jgi:hypothetical protein
MNNTTAQIVAYKGASACSLMKLREYLDDPEHTAKVVMSELQALLGNGPDVGAARHADRGAEMGRQHGGIQNSGSSVVLS